MNNRSTSVKPHNIIRKQLFFLRRTHYIPHSGLSHTNSNLPLQSLLEPTIRHVLHGIESVPQAFEITAHKGKYQAINPAQVVMRGAGVSPAGVYGSREAWPTS